MNCDQILENISFKGLLEVVHEIIEYHFSKGNSWIVCLHSGILFIDWYWILFITKLYAQLSYCVLLIAEKWDWDSFSTITFVISLTLCISNFMKSTTPIYYQLSNWKLCAMLTPTPLWKPILVEYFTDRELTDDPLGGG